MQPYRTIKMSAHAEMEVNKSRFIATVMRVHTEEQAQDFIRSLRKKYWDATHNCTAYLIGSQQELQKADDDGEPSGTAGRPILDVLKKQGLTFTAVVITRYFGGIKLGAGGLIRAYSTATVNGIAEAGIILCRPITLLAVTIDYPLLGVVERGLQGQVCHIQAKDFSHHVRLTLQVLQEEEQEMRQHLASWTNGKALIEDVGSAYGEFPILPS